MSNEMMQILVNIGTVLFLLAMAAFVVDEIVSSKKREEELNRRIGVEGYYENGKLAGLTYIYKSTK